MNNNHKVFGNETNETAIHHQKQHTQNSADDSNNQQQIAKNHGSRLKKHEFLFLDDYLPAFIRQRRQSFLVILTTALLTLQALLLTSVAKRNALRVHKTSVSVAVTFMFEVTKLAISFVGMSFDVGFLSSLRAIQTWKWSQVKLFAIPALAYLINDNLMFLLYSIIKVREKKLSKNINVIIFSC